MVLTNGLVNGIDKGAHKGGGFGKNHGVSRPSVFHKLMGMDGDFNLTRRAWHRTMGLTVAGRRSTEEGWGKRAVRSWAARHSYPPASKTSRAKNLIIECIGNLEYTEMTTRIINRGRGPEIEGTRITVYRIMDFVRDNCSMTTIADELDLSEAQVHAALDYIAANRAAVEAEYDQLLQRLQQANPPHIQAGRAQSLDELQRRIQARRLKDVDHAHRDR